MKRIILLMLSVLLLNGCAYGQAENSIPELSEPAGVKMDTARVIRGNMQSMTVYESTVTPEAAELYFEISGIIGRINVYPGQWVEAGDILMSIDQSTLEEQIANIKEQISYEQQDGEYSDHLAELNILMLNIERDRMIEEGADEALLAAKDIDIRQVQLDAKQEAELRELRIANLNNTLNGLQKDYGRNTITAPFSGHVYYDSNLMVGSSVHFGQTVINIVDPSSLTVSTDQYLNLEHADPSTYYAVVGDKQYSLQFIKEDSQKMASEILAGRTVGTRFQITSDSTDLQAGSFAALFIISNIKENVLQVPQNALFLASGERYVYIVNEKGLEKRIVKIGGSNKINVEILEGLEEGEIVYVPN